MANFFLSRKFSKSGIGYLDLDPGQPEFTAPGDLSLIHIHDFIFGPPFTHIVKSGTTSNMIHRSHHLGLFSPRDVERHYIDCSLDLFQHWGKKNLGDQCPLIVNCCGWVQGAGGETLESLIMNMKPTDIVYLDYLNSESYYQPYRDAAEQVQSEFHALRSLAPTAVTRTASDLRAMQMCSYFHLANEDVNSLHWDSNPLYLHDPYCLSYDGGNQTIAGIVIYGDEIDYEMLEEAIDGTLLALVALEDCSALFPSSQNEVMAQTDPDGHLAMTAHVGSSDPSEVPVESSRRPEKSLERHRYGLHRTQSRLPYLSTGTGVNSPLDPSKTSSLGQLLIRGIDEKRKELQVYTPIPRETIEAFRVGGKPLLLVRGKSAAPGWCYLEEYSETLNAESLKCWQDLTTDEPLLSGREHESGLADVWTERPAWVETR